MVLEIKEQIEKVCISPNSVCNFACRYCYFYNPENPIFLQKSLTETDIRTILDKIYGSGMDSLTPQESQFLNNLNKSVP